MTPVDVVIDFYRKHAVWPLVAWGLRQNREHINQIFVVNDEPWEERISDPLLPLVLLDHPDHEGFGAPRCIKKGVEHCSTPFVLHIDGDMVLSPGALEAHLEIADEQLLVYGLIHNVEQPPALEDLPRIFDGAEYPMEEDFRLDDPGYPVWGNFRDGHWLVHRESYLDLGGHDTSYPSYGLTDYDFGCRWTLKYGPESWILGEAEALHLDDKVSRTAAYKISSGNWEKFNPVMARFQESLE